MQDHEVRFTNKLMINSGQKQQFTDALLSALENTYDENHFRKSAELALQIYSERRLLGFSMNFLEFFRIAFYRALLGDCSCPVFFDRYYQGHKY